MMKSILAVFDRSLPVYRVFIVASSNGTEVVKRLLLRDLSTILMPSPSTADVPGRAVLFSTYFVYRIIQRRPAQHGNGFYEDSKLEFELDNDLLRCTNGRHFNEETVRQSLSGTDTRFLCRSEIGYLSQGKHRIGVDSNLGNASLAITRFSN